MPPLKRQTRKSHGIDINRSAPQEKKETEQNARQRITRAQEATSIRSRNILKDGTDGKNNSLQLLYKFEHYIAAERNDHYSHPKSKYRHTTTKYPINIA